MADKPQTFTERLRVDLGAVSSQWKQLEATARSLTAPRQMSSPNAVNEVRHAALAIRKLQGEIFKSAEVYSQMSQTLQRLEEMATALAKVHGLEINPEDYAPATGPVQEATFHQLPETEYELFDPHQQVGSSSQNPKGDEEW